MSAVYTRTASWELRTSRATRFRHRFGGPPPAVSPPLRGVPLHLLCTLDLADRRLELPFGVPELPLLFAFLYDAARMAYEVRPNGVRILAGDIRRPILDFPYPNYPAVLPERPLAPRKAAAPDLSPRRDLGNPFRRRIFADLPSARGRRDRLRRLARQDQVAILADLPQGPSREPCPRAGCGGRVEVFCVFDPIVIGGIHIWDASGEEEGVKIVYELCPRCAAIRVTTQCT